MNRFVLLLSLAGLVGGCAMSASEPPAQQAMGLASLAGTSWVATDLAPVAGSADQRRATPSLKFISLTQVAGHGGCNGYSGKAEIEGDALRLGPLASTRKLCPGPAMEVETAFFKALEHVRKARLTGSAGNAGQRGRVLELLDPAGTPVLSLQRVD